MRIIKLLLALVALTAQFSPAAPATQSVAERDIVNRFENGQERGLRVTLLLKDAGGAFGSVDPSREFKPEEAIKLAFESNVGGYLYLINRGTSGKNRLLFPIGRENNLIQPHRSYLLPTTHELAFDRQAGAETLQVLLAGRPLHFFKAARSRRDGLLDEAANLAAAKLWLKNADAAAAGVITGAVIDNAPNSKTAAIATRDSIWSAPRKTSYILLKQQPGGSPRLRPGEIVPFGLKLRHSAASQ